LAQDCRCSFVANPSNSHSARTPDRVERRSADLRFLRKGAANCACQAHTEQDQGIDEDVEGDQGFQRGDEGHGLRQHYEHQLSGHDEEQRCKNE